MLEKGASSSSFDNWSDSAFFDLNIKTHQQNMFHKTGSKWMEVSDRLQLLALRIRSVCPKDPGFPLQSYSRDGIGTMNPTNFRGGSGFGLGGF